MSVKSNQTKPRLVYGKTAAPGKKEDRRVRRTRDRLGDALVELLVEKPFAQIRIQDVLDRARVSRATFYTHFRDKDDLLFSDADEFMEGMAMTLARQRCKSERVAPVQELFAHVGEMRALHHALVKSGKAQEIWELAQGHFARGIEARLTQIPRGRAIVPARRPAMANAFAGALMAMLNWWVRHKMTPSPKEMDRLFHEMVWSGVNGKG